MPLQSLNGLDGLDPKTKNIDLNVNGNDNDDADGNDDVDDASMKISICKNHPLASKSSSQSPVSCFVP